jgi:hypothetical protein
VAATTHNTFETQRSGRENIKTGYCLIFAVNAILMASAITVSDPGLEQAIDSVNRQAEIPWSRCNEVKGTCVDTRSFMCSTRTIHTFYLVLMLFSAVHQLGAWSRDFSVLPGALARELILALERPHLLTFLPVPIPLPATPAMTCVWELGYEKTSNCV